MSRYLILAARRQYFGVIALALVLAAGVDAKTGGNLILGAQNAADQTTTPRNTSQGPALALTVKQGQPAFEVSSGVVIPRLNASLLNGKRAAAFAPASGSPNYAPASGSPNYAPASGSPNYAPRGTWSLLAEPFSQPPVPDNNATGMTFNFTAPADGTFRATYYGTCKGHGFMEIVFIANSKRVEVGDGVCGLEHSAPVTLGQLVSVAYVVVGFGSSLEITSGNRSVWFEPS